MVIFTCATFLKVEFEGQIGCRLFGNRKCCKVILLSFCNIAVFLTNYAFNLYIWEKEKGDGQKKHGKGHETIVALLE